MLIISAHSTENMTRYFTLGKQANSSTSSVNTAGEIRTRLYQYPCIRNSVHWRTEPRSKPLGCDVKVFTGMVFSLCSFNSSQTFYLSRCQMHGTIPRCVSFPLDSNLICTNASTNPDGSRRIEEYEEYIVLKHFSASALCTSLSWMAGGLSIIEVLKWHIFKN